MSTEQKPPIGAPVPPPLPPRAPKPTEHTPPFALDVSRVLERIPFRIPGGRYTTIGAALFAAGVLVGVVAAVTLKREPAPPRVDPARAAAVAAPVASATSRPEPPKPAVAPPRTAGPKPLAPLPEPVDPEPKAHVESLEKLVVDKTLPPVSGSSAPTCKQLLGKSLKVRHDPKRADYQTILANRELVRGNVKEAHKAYCLAWAWDGKNIDRRLNLARLYLVRRDWAKAAEYGQSALELDANDRSALGIVGDALAAQHKTEAARAAWLSAEGKPNASPSELDLIVRRDLALGKRVERLRDFSLAERFYRRVLLMDPSNTRAMLGIANCLIKAGDLRTAAAWAQKAKAPTS